MIYIDFRRKFRDFMRFFCRRLDVHWFVDKGIRDKRAYWCECKWCGIIRSGPR